MERSISSLEPEFLIREKKSELPITETEKKTELPTKEKETKENKESLTNGENNIFITIGFFILWLIVFFVFFWVFYYSMGFSFLLIQNSDNIDTLKVFIVSLISSLILVSLIFLIKFLYLRSKK